MNGLIPECHYHIASISDNGVGQPIADPYVINNVTEAHNVVVTYAIDTFTVNASVSGGNGSVNPASQVIDYGSPASIDLIPDLGYHIASIADNGTPQPVAAPYVIATDTD